jgi:DNA-binding CsgD family transcriptional regulator
MLTERLMDLTPASEAGVLSGDREEDETLTPRERDCMAFVAEGKSDWEISVILGISQSTAKFHVDNARRKLGAVNRAQAVARFVVGGFASPGRFIKG